MPNHRNVYISLATSMSKTGKFQLTPLVKINSLKELKAIPAEAYKKCMGNWINRWHACIGSKGVYFKGNNKDFY